MLQRNKNLTWPIERIDNFNELAAIGREDGKRDGGWGLEIKDVSVTKALTIRQGGTESAGQFRAQNMSK